MPRGAQPFVAGFIALMIAAAVFAWEPWPFTSFRLFSHLRTDEQTGWVIKAVRPSGSEEALPLTDELRGFVHQVSDFSGASAKRQDELCRVWLGAAPGILSQPVAEVRLYLRRWKLSEREGDEALPGTSSLEYLCTEDGAHDAG